MMKRCFHGKGRVVFTAVLAALLCVFVSGCVFVGAGKSVTVASKLFTENILLGEMYAQLIENHTEIEVVRKHALGGTKVCYDAMRKEGVDIYVDYTGTLYNEVLMLEFNSNLSTDELYNTVIKRMADEEGVMVFSPIGINNTFALAMLKDKAAALGIETMSDLSAVAPRMVFAANSIYYTRRNDGYQTMTDRYGMSFMSSAQMDTELLYDAVSQGQVDVMVAYATDSLLKKNDMVILEDDKKMFPDYRGVPIARSQIIDKYPELKEVLEYLHNRISDERMQELNYMVDIENKTPDEVARSFLTEEGLLKK